MNHYEQKVEARKERLEARAARLAQESDQLAGRAMRMAEVIPFGQPILVGHHSEGRDRRYRSKIDNTFRKASETHKEAQEVARRASSVGTGGISSDDPDALEKLKGKLAEAEHKHGLMVAMNKAIRKHGKKTEPERSEAIQREVPDFSLAAVQERLKPNCFGGIGFERFELSNSKARINHTKDRIAALEKQAQRVDKAIESDRYTYREDTELNRVMFILPAKPSGDIIAMFKRNGFRWSPSNTAWQRHLNNAGIYAARIMKQELDK